MAQASALQNSEAPKVPLLPKVSVIVPLFNEAESARDILSALIEKRLEGAQMELILVESNSTDGTREIVRSFEGKPGVQVIWQESPKGKGNADADFGDFGSGSSSSGSSSGGGTATPR
ncbi:MAG: glycosyltransferase [Planctomycetes bacterium]|nr:glycosyltransferase [Planctomycetota bacterium]